MAKINVGQGKQQDMTTGEVEYIGPSDEEIRMKELAHKLDSNYGSLLLNQRTIQNIQTELGQISDDIENTNENDLQAMGMTLHDISNSVQLITDLMTYTADDFKSNLAETGKVKEDIFNIAVK
ncbi:MAG TPA: hypothetical protein VK085_07560 [Pseudogracilibacillus sp.]|nr:hypothetical protein [Pseudogracilibacillus sp.]